MTAGTNTPDTLSAIFAMGALVAAASLTIWMICESVVSSPTRVASASEKAGLVDRGGGNRVARGLVHRDALAGQRRFVDRAAALQHHAVHRNALARAHDEDSRPSAPARPGPPTSAPSRSSRRRLGRQLHQAFQRVCGLALGARLQHFAHGNQRQNHGRGLKIEVHHVVHDARPYRRAPARRSWRTAHRCCKRTPPSRPGPPACPYSARGASRLLKPLMKNFWLMTMMMIVSSSCVRPMATWLSL